MKRFAVIFLLSFFAFGFQNPSKESVIVDNCFAKNPFQYKITLNNIDSLLNYDFEKEVKTYKNTHNAQLVDTFYIYKKNQTRLFFLKSGYSNSLIKVEIRDNSFKLKRDIKIGMDINTFKAKFSIKDNIDSNTIIVTDDEDWDANHFIFEENKLVKINVFFGYN